MVKVAHVLKSLDLGGTTKTAQLFCEYLSSHGEHEVVLLYNAEGDQSRLPLFAEHTECLPFAGEDGCAARIRQVAPDIVHVYRSGFPEWPHPSPDCKFVETNVFGMYDADIHIDKTLYMSKWLYDEAIALLRPISRGIGKWDTRFDYVNNPIKRPVNNSMMSLAKDSGAIYLGRCGRPDNGIYDSISVKAAWMLRGSGFDVRFIVMAPPPNMLLELSQYGIPYHVVDPTVDETALSAFYNTVDIYAHARADGETFGCNIAEAMYHGLPVVTHVAVPSVPGMGVFQSQTTLIETGVDGFVCSHDVSEYADALKTLVEDKQRRLDMGRNAAETARQRFDWRIAGAKLANIYREMLDD